MANFDDEELEELNYNDFKSQGDYQPSPAVEEELPTDTSQAEEKSPKARTYKHTNDVQVTVSDKSTPIVVLFGPPACGKTMTLIRLSRYLKTIQGGYRIEPVRSFRPSDDADYLQMCDDFPNMLNSSDAADSTSRMSFMLVGVSRNVGQPICQILEAPGELYFDPDKPSGQDPLYLTKIHAMPNKKVWIIFLEPEWLDDTNRNAYVDRIKNLKAKMSRKDRVIFLGNKVDKKAEYIKAPGEVNEQAYRDYFCSYKGGGLYPGLFAPFKDTRPIISFFKPYDCDFVPFMTGSYVKGSGSKLKFVEESDKYPQKLWNKILKSVGR